jgi:hypothetical protein
VDKRSRKGPAATKRAAVTARKSFDYLARPAGLEPTTPWFVVWEHQVFEFTLFFCGHVRCKVHDRAQQCITDFGKSPARISPLIPLGGDGRMSFIAVGLIRAVVVGRI